MAGAVPQEVASDDQLRLPDLDDFDAAEETDEMA
jgi:hypothetical protein